MFCSQCRAENRDGARFCAACGASLTTGGTSAKRVDPLDVGATEYRLSSKQILANRYEIRRELGAGGLGIVYLAHDQALDMEVAIKVLKPLLARDPQAVDDLKKEAKIAMTLSHKNIMRVHNFEDQPEIKFLTMEYINGTTLAELKVRNQSGKLPLDIVIEYAKQICAGLDYAHEQKIVHRDIKPANIMLNQQGVVKIADFGIARVAKDSASRLSNVDTSGTLLYMAPEHVKGKGIDAQSDIYSLGATIYELLSGHPPFYTGDVRYQILTELPESIEGIPKHINEIILKALAKDKGQRWKTALALLAALEGRVDENEERRRRERERQLEDERRRLEEEKKRLAEQRAREEMLREQQRLLEEQQRQAAVRLAEEARRAQEAQQRMWYGGTGPDYGRQWSDWWTWFYQGIRLGDVIPVKPCPDCRGAQARQVISAWWGGRWLPRKLHHVKCQKCGKEYDGETGKSNTGRILRYYAIFFFIFFVFTANQMRC